MSAELRYLAYTAFLTAALWIPYIVCQVQTNGFLSPGNYVTQRRARFLSGACAPI